MRVLLTGATGFVGNAFLQSISDEDEVVYLGRAKSSLGTSKQITYLKVDLTSLEMVNEAARSIEGEFDVLVHLAAYVPRDGLSDSLHDGYTVNVHGTINLLEAFRGRFKRLVIGSTAEVYDQSKIRGKIKEDAPLGAGSYYGSTKLSSELIAQTFGKKNNIPTIVLRFSVMYGSNDPISRALPNFIKSALRNKSIEIKGGQALRDYVYIDDVVKSLHHAMSSNASGVVNIGTGIGVSIENAAKYIIQAAGSHSGLIVNPGDSGVDIVMDTTEAERLIQFKAGIIFPDNIDVMIESYC